MPGGFIAAQKLTVTILFSLFLFSCSQLPIENNQIGDKIKKQTLKMLSQQIESTLLKSIPFDLTSVDQFTVVNKLPGPAFRPSNLKVNPLQNIEFDLNGNLLLAAGDYSLPVMTYCLKSSARSPIAYSYVLSKLQGPKAELIRDINLKAFPRFDSHDVQILIWSVLSGLSYAEMTSVSQKIIDETIPDKKDQLKESVVSNLKLKWNEISKKSNDTIPDFESSADQLLLQLGETGKKIIEMRNFKYELERVGNNYTELSQNIITEIQSHKLPQITPWSQISNRVYARFITETIYLSIGYIQIRVLPGQSLRRINSVNNKVVIDYSGWFANPKNSSIQPLSFSMLYGFGGVTKEMRDSAIQKILNEGQKTLS